MTDKHSQEQWSYVHVGDNEYAIMKGPLNTITHVHGEEDAELITKAVNERQELIEALEKCIKMMGQLSAEIQCRYEYEQVLLARKSNLVDKTRAILTKAQGQE